MTSPLNAQSSLLDDAWLAAPPRRSRLRVALLVLLAAAVVFLGGVEVQKQYGATSAGTAAGPRALGAGGPPAGFGGGAPGATGAQAPASPSAGGGTAAPTDQTALIGVLQKVDGAVWVVKDLGGTVHRVTVGSTVTVTKQSTLTAGQVASGTTVDVSGSTDAQGRVTATTITIR